MRTITVEELEIIVSAKIEQIKPQMQKVVQEVRKAVQDTEGFGTKILSKSDTEKIVSEARRAGQKVKEVFNPNDTSGIKIQGQNVIKGISNAYSNLKGSTADLGNMVELSNYKNKLSEIATTAQRAKQQVESVKSVHYDSAAIQRVVDGYSRGTNEVKKTQENLKKSTVQGNRLASETQKIKNHLQGSKSGSNLLNAGLSKAKSVASAVSSKLKIGLGQIIKMAGALLGLRSMYNILRNSASAWLSSQNLQAQQLQANIDYMKYALGSALAPVIETIVNLIYQALRGVQSLIYALTGVNIFANASAKAYASMAKGAKDTQKAMQGVADIDEIHNIQQDNSSGRSGSGSGIAPNFDLSGIDTAKWSKLIEDIKNGDWESIGSSIGEKINGALEKINWTKIKTTAGNIGKNLAGFINGGVSSTDWKLVGKTAAEGVNTVFSFLKNFFENTDFRGMGEAVSKTINGFFDNVEWDTVGQTLSSGVEGALEFMLGAMETFDAGKVDSAIKQVVENIDWGSISDKIFELLGYWLFKFGPLGQAIQLGKTLVELFKNAIPYFKEHIDSCGGDIVSGLLEGILDGLANIGTWIYDHVFKPFLEGIKKAFGIHSPSTEMAKIGTYIMEGLKNGIESFIGKIGETWDRVKESVSQKVESIKSTLVKILGKAWVLIVKGAEGATNSIISAINRVIEGINKFSNYLGFEIKPLENVHWAEDFEKELNKMNRDAEKTGKDIDKSITTEMQNTYKTSKGILTTFNSDFKSKTEQLKSTANTNVIGIKNNTVTTLTQLSKNPIYSKLKTNLENALNQYKNSKTWGTNTTSNYVKGISSQQSPLNKVLSTAKKTIQTYLNQSGASQKWGSQTMSKYKEGVNGQNSPITKALASIKNTLKNSLSSSNNSYTWGVDMMQGFIRGINAKKSALSGIMSGVAAGVAAYMHFSRPDKGPLREYETWMPDMVEGLSDSLLQSAPMLDNAVAQVSNSIADNLRATNLGVDVSSSINKNITSNVMSSQLENAVYSAIQKAEKLFSWTINNELKVNSKTIAKEIIDDLNNEAKRRGYKPILQH